MIRTLSFALLIIVLIYGGYKAWPLVSGPRIQLEIAPQAPPGEPGPDVTTISGTAIHTETLTLNGAILLIDEKGHFEKKLTLPRGGVILTLTASDRFGRSRTEERNLLVP